MEIATDSNLLARSLLTLTTLGYGLVTIRVDFNKTHATNPLWTPHARFHVVWQILSYFGIALIALGLIWVKGPVAAERLCLAAALAVAVYGAFFVATFAQPLFGGSLYDTNGYLPFRPPFGPAHWRWDVSVPLLRPFRRCCLLVFCSSVERVLVQHLVAALFVTADHARVEWA
jgi:hypothetical protein